MSLPRKSCHNCRRRRLRCDRSLPQCHKCSSAGQECLGYQPLLTWTQGVASRGKMSGVTFEDMKKKQVKQERLSPESSTTANTPRNLDSAAASPTPIPEYSLKSVLQPSSHHSSRRLQVKRKAPFQGNIKLSLGRHLTDPFLQDLDQNARFYISYFNRNVCKDLVIYDFPKQNPFRELIPLATQHPVLRNIIIANSALNMSNASQRTAPGLFAPSLQLRSATRTIPQLRISSTSQSTSRYQDALLAKQRALRLLYSVLNDVDSSSIDIALGSVLLFTEFELADFGTRDWRLHMHGARALINSLKESYKLQYSNMSTLRRCLISNCLVYDVLSSTFAHKWPSEPPRSNSVIMRSSLQYAEANNYLSFPALLLEAVLIAAQLSQTVQNNYPSSLITDYQKEQLLFFLNVAQSFDARDWASTIQGTSPHFDFESRIHIASAHKAAVCIYISRIILSLSPTTDIPNNLDFLVSDIIHHLSFVMSNSELFKATSWPTFVAGVDARDFGQQAWAMARLQELWECLPCTMGYVRSAMEVLGVIWDKRDAAVCGDMPTVDWIQDLKMSELDLMIA